MTCIFIPEAFPVNAFAKQTANAESWSSNELQTGSNKIKKIEDHHHHGTAVTSGFQLEMLPFQDFEVDSSLQFQFHGEV